MGGRAELHDWTGESENLCQLSPGAMSFVTSPLRFGVSEINSK